MLIKLSFVIIMYCSLQDRFVCKIIHMLSFSKTMRSDKLPFNYSSIFWFFRQSSSVLGVQSIYNSI